MFKKLKAGIINMAKNAVKSLQEERESKYGLVKTITKDVVDGLNYDGNVNLRKIGMTVMVAGVAMIPIGAIMVINSYIK